ncbi:YihY family inner membrane protein [Thiobacter aerophilum]|uniref:UPF0761 membrane protein V6E02_09080 n=1 Tax=Thiobacter aerophilum TaxID=3121275 RepID=A0ABV0EIX0_9BURK
MSARPAPWRVLRRSPAFLRFVLQRFLADRCPQTAAALAYTTLLALVPLVTVALVVLAAFPVFEEIITALKIFLLTHMVPEIAGRIITVYMLQFSEKAARLTLVGIAFLMLTALMLMHTIEESFNAIWRVRQPRRLAQRFVTYWAVLTVGPLLLGASLSITSYLVSLSLGYTQRIPFIGVYLLRPVPLVLMSLTFALLYMLVPNRSVAFRHALAGGLAAGLAFELMKKGFAWYITSFPTFRLVYGAFAALPIFLVWVYLSWLVVLAGAVITASLPAWMAGATATRHKPGWHFVAALELLLALAAAQEQGETRTLEALRRGLPADVEETEALLDTLRTAGLVARSDNGDWLLARAPGHIALRDVHRLFVWDAKATSSRHPGITRFLAALAETGEGVLAATLADLAAGHHS